MNEMILVNNQYELTLEYVKSNFNITFVDDGVLQSRIKSNSRKIYNYIYSRAYSHNRPIVEKILNTTKEGYDFMLEALTIQMTADLETGYNDLTIQPGINVKNGQVIDRYEMFRNVICPDAELFLDNCAGYFNGVNILQQCAFNFIPGGRL